MSFPLLILQHDLPFDCFFSERTLSLSTFDIPQARRAFRALRGIIRLQALIRGHLVRRQAVATLRCMQAIVKIQALARGRRVRLLDPGHQLLGKYSFEELKVTLAIWVFLDSPFPCRKFIKKRFSFSLTCLFSHSFYYCKSIGIKTRWS